MGHGLVKTGLCRDDGFRKLQDKSVWITDARIAVQVAAEGCTGFDFHGQQPVGVNAQVLRAPKGVLRLALAVTMDGMTSTYPLIWRDVRYSNWGISGAIPVTPHLRVNLSFTTAQAALLIDGTVENMGQKPVRAALHLIYDSAGQYTAVHGQRRWDPPRVVRGYLLLHAHNQVLLCDWVKEKKQYLVPVAEHDRVFLGADSGDINMVSGDPKIQPWVWDSDEVFVDAHIHGAIGGHGYEVRVNGEEYGITSPAVTIKPCSEASLARAVVGFGSSQDELQDATARWLLAEEADRDPVVGQERRYAAVAERQPRLEVEGFPEVGELFSQVPVAVEASRIPAAGVTRASASSYYWVWGWDNLATGHELARFGDADFQRQMIQFFLANRWRDGSIPHRFGRSFEVLQTGHFGVTDSLFASLVYTHYVATQDAWVDKEVYPVLVEMFTRIVAKTDERGFYRGVGIYPDHPRRMGRDEQSVVAQEMAALYLFARIMVFFAHRLGDTATYEVARDQAALLEQHFLPVFFCPQLGAIADHVDARGRRAETYPSYSYLGLMHALGVDLVRPVLGQLGQFFAASYMQPHGVGVMPAWDRYARTEPVHSSWYLHWDRYVLKVLRRTGRGAAIMQYLELLSDVWRRFAYLPELVRLDAEFIDPVDRWLEHGQPWNVNCATGVYGAIIESVLGLEVDAGGVTYIPCDLPCDLFAERMHLGRGQWQVEICGRGPHVGHLAVDGQKLVGTCKVPFSLTGPGDHVLKIARTDRSAEHPILAEAAGAMVCEVWVEGRCLHVGLTGWGSTHVVFWSAQRPSIRWRGQPMDFHWDDRMCRAVVKVSLDEDPGEMRVCNG